MVEAEDTEPQSNSVMIHRIYGIVKEESNWAPKTNIEYITSTPVTVDVGRERGVGDQTPRPKVSRRKYLKTPLFSRNLNDLAGGRMVDHSRVNNTQGAVSNKHKPLEAKKPSWIDALGKEYIGKAKLEEFFVVMNILSK